MQSVLNRCGGSTIFARRSRPSAVPGLGAPPTASGCELLANVDPTRYERAASRWLQRFIEERQPPLAEVALAASALAELDAIAAELSKPYRPLPAFGAATGLRPEEWSALERRHIDRTRRLVKIEQKNVDARIVPGTKTKTSVREVPLTRRALAALDTLAPRLDTPLVFPAPEGGPLNLDNFRKREWAPAVEAAGVATPATPYDLRDTFASNALAAGVTVFELARVMGTSVRMIERHYGALLDGAHNVIASRLDAFEAELEKAAGE